MSKSTPGPWEVDKVKSHPWVVTCTDKNLGCQNALVEVGYKPNAHLIASAPEVLEACKEAIEWMERRKGDEIKIITKGNQAIAKAEQ